MAGELQMLKTIISYLLEKIGYEIVSASSPQVAACWPRQLHQSLTSFEDDGAFHSVYERAQCATQMTETDNSLRRQRYFITNQLLRQADLGRGDVCEAGCFRGLSAHLFAQHIQELDQQVSFHIFDSFQGLSELESVDVPEDWDQRYKRQSDWSTDKIRKQFACSLQTVRENLREFDFIHYHEGWIPTRFHEVADKSFSFVHIDVDLYRPIMESFQFFYPRLIPHGIMVFDDYGSTQFPAAKKAIDECLRKYNNTFFVSTASGVAFLIKDF
ncbi:MAG: hypothetical protein CL612_01645 [Anaerolineaceae bacterium]|nr:hypothetical protein [Anaerolineaceae bacterium]